MVWITASPVPVRSDNLRQAAVGPAFAAVSETGTRQVSHQTPLSNKESDYRKEERDYA